VIISKTKILVTVLALANHSICALESHVVSYSANSFMTRSYLPNSSSGNF